MNYEDWKKLNKKEKAILDEKYFIIELKHNHNDKNNKLTGIQKIEGAISNSKNPMATRLAIQKNIK